MITISDVAKEASVSVSTVSRILNKDKEFNVSEETIQKVNEAVEKLNYRPLRKRKHQTRKRTDYQIGVVTTVSKSDEADDPYWISIRAGIENQAASNHVSIKRLIRMDHNLTKEEVEELDGLIVIGAVIPESISRMGKSVSNVVLVNNTYPTDKFDIVNADLYDATIKNLKHLETLDHEHIGFIGGEDVAKDLVSKSTRVINDIRKTAFEDHMRNRGTYNAEDIYIGDWTSRDGYRLMKKALIKRRIPSAFIVASDPMAIGVLHAIRESGLRVPEDISIISYDDIEAAAFVEPPLSSVRIYTEEVGKQAVNVLIDRMKGREIPIKVIVPSKLVKRKSYARRDRRKENV